METSNPTLSQDTFSRFGYSSQTDSMSMQGTVVKTAILLLLALFTASWMWMKFFKSGGNVAALTPWMISGVIGGLVLAVATVFKPIWAPVTAPLYALAEGFFIGGISATMEASFPGIVMQASLLTFGTLFAMLFAYQAGLIRATDTFKKCVVAATGGIMIAYLASWVLSFFSVNISFITGNSMLSIGISLFVVVIAALNFVLDFDFIEQSSRRGAPKFMEWYGAFALMVTLIWLYVEFLRLLSKLRSR